MRLIRIGDHPSQIGADVTAALTSWSRGDAIVGGIALIGPQPPGCPQPVDAVVVLPRGVLVIAGVDLPDPAMRLDAPLSGPWKTDGWPLVRPEAEDGSDNAVTAVNPAKEAMAASGAISTLLQTSKAEPVPVSTVVAVGPYVSQVSQPTADLMRGVRILHPEPMTLLTATRELAVHERPCTVRQAQGILAALAPDAKQLTDEDLLAEGFSNATSDLASASTTLIPKFRDNGPKPKTPKTGKQGRGLRWLPIAAVGLVGVLLLAGIIVAVASASGDDTAAPPSPSQQPVVPPPATTTSAPATKATTKQDATRGLKDGDFAARGVVQDADCAADADGDMQVWLEQHGCDHLLRSRYEVSVNGRQAAVLLAVLAFPDSGSATQFQGVADTPGGGTVLDPSAQGVSAQGKPWPDGVTPDFSSAGYASAINGSTVTLAQTTWVTGKAKPDDPALAALARRALLLPPPQ